MLALIEGIFSFVIIETNNNEPQLVIAARDPFGIKPLFWGTRSIKTKTGDGTLQKTGLAPTLVLSSELKCFSASLLNKRMKTNVYSTSFDELLPGHFLCYHNPNKTTRKLSFTTSQYFSPKWLHFYDKESLSKFQKHSPTFPKIEKSRLHQFYSELKESVGRRLMSDKDIKVGVLLSGGVDSAIIASLVAETLSETKETLQELHTFSIGIQTEGDEETSKDLHYAKVVSNQIGSIHHEYTFTLEEGQEALEKVIYHLETNDVITVRAAVPLFLLCKKISEEMPSVKVVLCGEGADELFAGYSLYSVFSERELLPFSRELVRRLLQIADNELLRVDRCSMAFGIEARVPFLDINVIESAMTLFPPSCKLSHMQYGTIEKYWLRKCAHLFANLPEEVIWRKKEGIGDGVGHSWISSLQCIAKGNEVQTYKKIFDTCLSPQLWSVVEKRNLRRRAERYDSSIESNTSVLMPRKGKEKEHLLTSDWESVSKHKTVDTETYLPTKDLAPTQRNSTSKESDIKPTRKTESYPFPPGLNTKDGSSAIKGWITIQTDPDLSNLITKNKAKQFVEEILNLPFNLVSQNSVSSLNQLIQAMLRKIPFHNLTMLVRERRPPTLEEIFSDVSTGLGGPCFVVNSFFLSLLHTLGFEVSILSCEIHQPDCHVAGLVAIKGKYYYVDVGNGKPYFEAVQLGDETQKQINDFAWKLIFNRNSGKFEMYHGWKKAGKGKETSEEEIEMQTGAAIKFDPYKLVRWRSFLPMVKRSRSELSYGPFLTGLRLARFSSDFSLIAMRDNTLIVGKNRTVACTLDQLTSFALDNFGHLPNISLLFACALDVLRDLGKKSTLHFRPVDFL
eukprot:CAMPEP_0174259074 /NCGR_PEP_ID=MMETSP0439-20130205/7954_1 /TAXON_ID=0 /ORGANISM="Stereomyxa ramosa, Strain Chinc5" /LENGTH=846 /DNA_ID=CAMNT_0015342823 /DNA_START=418 /DNA_END=2954 /DNA_ORIENTATION=-